MFYLLILIYSTFISLGLPDSLVGTTWPVMQVDFGAKLSSAGLIAMITTAGTVVSSLSSDTLIRCFGTGRVTAVSVGLTAIALFGFHASLSLMGLCLWAIPLGLGGGAVDAGLNNFVAFHYKAIHMNWLHCFWGVGASAGPVIVSLFIAEPGGWRTGYLVIALIQAALSLLLFCTLFMWKKVEFKKSEKKEMARRSLPELLKTRGVPCVLFSFFCYSTVEVIVGLWGSSYLVQHHHVTAEQAAIWGAVFYMGITAGRFISGIFALRLSNTLLIRLGEVICLLGGVVLLLPFSRFTVVGFLLIGMGLAPIYPAMLFETPLRFGRELSQGLMGVQMACAYIGGTFMPPLFGVVAEKTSIEIFPWVILFVVAIMLLNNEKVTILLKKTRS